MHVPISWLRDFAPFDGDPVALGEVFDDLGMVVESITHVGGGLDGVVVSTVRDIQPIPGADKIRKVLVDAGDAELTQVVCGAWNFTVGDSVPLARVGAVLPGDFAIARRKMKGVSSEGMLCSGREIGIGDDAAGLLVLPPGLTPGEPIATALGITADVVYDLAIEANRPDANCIAGVARDGAARLGIPFAIPGVATPPFKGDSPFSVEVDAPDLCDRFTASVFSGLTVGPSPEWVVRRLALAGMRPISNVVDASNYVMLELGQPTHAYDLERLPSPRLRVRAAVLGEQLTTLDDVVRVLGDGTHPDCLICDGADQPIGIAGIMGGASSEVHEGTTRIVFEAAHFVPMAVARTSKRIGLRSEASARFERGVDVNGAAAAIARFAQILRESCPGLQAEGPTVDWRAEAAGVPPVVALRTDRVNAVLGTTLRDADIVRLLTPIGFAVTFPDAGEGRVTVPTFRPDVVAEIDVVEEVARHHGYSSIARTKVRPDQVGRLTAAQRSRRQVRALLAAAGLSEAMTGPLVGPGDHQRAGLPEDGIGAVDPLVREESILRTSLLPGLLRAARFNTDRRNPDLGLFEVGATWRAPHPSTDGVSPGPDSEPGRGLPDEREMVAFLLAGRGPQGTGAGAPAAVRTLRRLARGLRVAEVALEAIEVPGLHPTRTAEVLVGGRNAGWVGEVDPRVVEAWGLDAGVGWCELELATLVAGIDADAHARPVSKFPSSDLDLAFVCAASEAAGSVQATLVGAAGAALEWIELFDVYRAAGVGENERSLAFRLRLVAVDHTLTEAELGEIRDRCIAAVEKAHPARLRR
ncbi:MAG: phenylalanine--tRNA ligase subunit beta [Acidimicrobiales bacterium]